MFNHKQALLKITEEKDRIQSLNKLSNISQKILNLIKSNPNSCNEEYKKDIKKWCKIIYTVNEIENTWKFFEGIKGMFMDADTKS